MRCCICETKMYSGGIHNPFPICAKNDDISKCCSACNEIAIRARMISIRMKEKPIEQLIPGDELVIFYANKSDEPLLSINRDSKFITGSVEHTQLVNGKFVAFGSWGNYNLTNEDNYMCM